RELSIFLWRLAGKPAVSGYLPFSDLGKYTRATDTYKAILWCYTNGIDKGYSDGTFRPDNPIVRKDTMIMLYRLAGKPAVSGTLKFPDARALGYGPETDTYKSIVWGTQLEITKGYSDGSFKPLANCLREHIVTFVYRYDQKYN
ncbi:MAG: S-layer homology domain-containing protein, partial [Solobacterium sp.]|nr:S-layer homology domain-containing protein [Solobacterium sp.]